MVETAKAADKLNVFISYSRDDLEFADQLDASLQLGGFETTIDRRGMSGGEDWKARLGALIRDADTVVFALSPSSARSDICVWEVAEAVQLGKRIIPVLCRPLGDAEPPQQLADRDYIYFYPEPKFPGSGFGPGLLRLAAALNTDPGWLREHTRYLRLAKEWEEVGKPENRRLLSAADIALAKEWAKTRPAKAPELTALQREFLSASEEEDIRQGKAKAAAEVERREAAERTAAEAKSRRRAQAHDASRARGFGGGPARGGGGDLAILRRHCGEARGLGGPRPRRPGGGRGEQGKRASERQFAPGADHAVAVPGR